jgi:hypothetical protein
MSKASFTLQRINWARDYTRELLQDVKPNDWFRMPGGVTHLAWQVGHLAVAEYRLALERVRGRLPTDDDVISEAFVEQFGRGSTPQPDPEKNLKPAELLRVMDRVHELVNREVPKFSDAELDQPLLSPHRLAKTKYEALLWCSNHESLHAGQIGLIKRLLGQQAKW